MIDFDPSKLYVELYQKFSARMKLSSYSAFVNFGWYSLPDQISGFWLIYIQMLDDFARNLANSINTFGYNIERLRTWNETLSEVEGDKRDQALFEFVDNVFVAAMCTPHIVRDRFIFFGTHLCQQVNRARLADWKDDIPENRNIKLKDLELAASHWASGRHFVDSIKALNAQSFVSDTKGFRNHFHHQLPSQEIVGVASYIVRKKIPGAGVTYALMQNERTSLTHISNLLENELKSQLTAFDSFKLLVDEQLKFIFKP